MYKNIADLIKQIKLGEDSALELKNVEFSNNKITGPHRDSLADDLAAMANTVSGVFVFGVEDNSREIVGIPLDKLDLLENWLHNICNDLITPPLSCIIRKILIQKEEEEDKVILSVDVPRSLFVHKSPNGYFCRSGSSKREMQPDALARLFQQRSQVRIIRFDEQIVPNTTIESLNPALWKRFKTVLSPQNDLEFLEKMQLISRDIDGIQRATVSGVLLCSDSPENYINNAFIQAVSYRGTERNAAYQLDTQDITGPLDLQIKNACQFVRRNMSVFATKAPHRIETPQFSLNAVFEAIVNAVAHRDYSIYGSKIRLHQFFDRLEIFSPGSIPNTMSIESISERQSSRNELISSLLARCPMNVDARGSSRSFIMDKRGEGVPIIITESEELSKKKPVYKLLDDAELMLTIYAAEMPEL